MKKALLSILAVLYLTITSGLVVNWHYCMGRLASIDYGAYENKVCGKCGMKDKKGCCETEHQFLKVDDAHQLVKLQFEFNAFAIEAPKYVALTQQYIPQADQFITYQSHAPPNLELNKLYPSINVFRI
ncbi:MAG: hypothetical protein K2P88_11605 [Chitinophagaceae bacterium]|nr:hypothetical protein [Chitinophagaceae bacterium]